jgi:hypothetical protein
MSVDKTKCCKTHTKEKEKSGECCQIDNEQDRANDLSFENNGEQQEDKNE